MDNQGSFKQFYRAVFHELFRSATAYNVLAAIVLLGVVCGGYFWPERYVSTATVASELGSARADISDQDLIAEMAPSELANYQIAIEKSVERFLALYYSKALQAKIYQRLVSTHPNLALEFRSEMDFFEHLLVQTAPRSNLIQLSFYSHSPTTTVDALTVSIEELLLQSKPEEKLATISTQVEDIAQNEASLRQTIEELESDIEALKTSLGGIGVAQGRERIRSIRVSMEDAQVGINASNARIDGIRGQLEKEEALYKSRQRLVVLQTQEAKLVSELEKAQGDYGPNAPQIISLQQELDNVRIELAELKNNPLVFADNSDQPLYEQLRKKLTLEEVEKQSAESRYESLRKLLSEETSRVSEYQNKAKEISLREEALEGLRMRLAQILEQKKTRMERQSRIENNLPTYRLVEAPVVPERYQGIGYREFLILGPLLAITLPLLAAVFIVLFDSRIRNAGQVKSVVGGGIPLLAVIPHYSSPKTTRIFRKAVLSIVVWGIIIFSAYATLGVIGLRS